MPRGSSRARGPVEGLLGEVLRSNFPTAETLFFLSNEGQRGFHEICRVDHHLQGETNYV